jgi:membrane protein YdbS with pleckstrin-like domain
LNTTNLLDDVLIALVLITLIVSVAIVRHRYWTYEERTELAEIESGKERDIVE